MMNSTKFYKIAVLILLAINLIILGIFITRPKHPLHPKLHSPKEIIAKKLDFSEEQISDYHNIISLHQKKIKIFDAQIHETKKELYELLKANEESTEKESILIKIAAIQKEIEHTHYLHFLEIKSICTAEQNVKFISLIDEIQEIFSQKRVVPNQK